MWNERWIRSDFNLPGRNRFVCENFSIVNNLLSKTTVVPQLVYKVANVAAFFLPDQIRQLPFAHAGLHIISPMINSIRHFNVLTIFSMMVKDFLSQEITMMKFAGFSIDLHACNNGLTLRLGGFNEKIFEILEKVVKAIHSVDEIFEKSRFEYFKKHLRKNCYNNVVNPNTLIEDLRLHIVNQEHKFYLNRFKDNDGINFYESKFYISEILKTISIKLFVGGNVREDEVKSFAEIIPKTEYVYQMQHSVNPIREIPMGSNYLRLRYVQFISVIIHYIFINLCFLCLGT